MTIEELHQILSLLARSGMRDSSYMIQTPKASMDYLARKHVQKVKNKFYIQTRLFD